MTEDLLSMWDQSQCKISDRLRTLFGSFHRLKIGGYYIIEELSINDFYKLNRQIDFLKRLLSTDFIDFCQLRISHNLHVNYVLIIKKNANLDNKLLNLLELYCDVDCESRTLQKVILEHISNMK